MEPANEVLIVGVAYSAKLISPPSGLPPGVNEPEGTLWMRPTPCAFQQRLDRRIVPIRCMEVVADDKDHYQCPMGLVNGFHVPARPPRDSIRSVGDERRG